MYFDSKVRGEKLEELRAKLREVVTPVVEAQVSALHSAQLSQAKKELAHALANKGEGEGNPAGFAAAAASVRAAALSSFRKAFNEDLRLEGYSGWEGKEAYAAFEQALDSHIASVRVQRISEVGGGVGGAVKKVACTSAMPSHLCHGLPSLC
jgi:hypothetical protein